MASLPPPPQTHTYTPHTHTPTHTHVTHLRPMGLSKFCSLRSTPLAARRSPRVSAPRLCSRRATAAAKRFSPPIRVEMSLRARGGKEAEEGEEEERVVR